MLLVLLIALAFLLTAAVVVLTLALAQRSRRLHEVENAIVALARSWSEDGSSRGRICAAAQQAMRAEFVLLAEPARRGEALVVTATSSATALGGTEFPLDGERSLAARAFLTGAPIDVAGNEDVSDESLRRMVDTAAKSAHLRPVLRDGRIVGVLVLAWRERREALPAGDYDLVAVLADEVGRAIERDAHVSLLARQARTDELTALPNRRAWNEAVTTEMARAQRTGQPLCLAVLDLDHFKAFNDTHGHPAGDAHLRRTAAAWRRELRAIDILARYGGEEFGVLLPNTDLARAEEVVNRVRASTPGGETASAGVVIYDTRESRDSLLARADAALYRAKHAGRATTVPA